VTFLRWKTKKKEREGKEGKISLDLLFSSFFFISGFSQKTTMASQPQPRHENAEKSG
jgi:hypothetical protein